MKKIIYLTILFPFMLPAQQADVTVSKAINRIAFGSCSKQDWQDNQLWAEVNATNPDLWIWLGDNIYADTEDMTVMKSMYALQKSHPDYQQLLSRTEVIGTWDDHDYGANDAGKEYPMKAESKEELFTFLDVDKNHPARKREGVYQSYTYKSESGNLKVILLDVRYFRDSLKWTDYNTPKKVSLVNPTGDILGEAQWKWLEKQLSEDGIDLFLIASGIQAIPSAHVWEKWSNFPKARTRLFEVLKKAQAPMVLLTGDRHISEISKYDLPGHPFPLYEFTSSSLNAAYPPKPDENDYRIGEVIHQQNFAAMMIMWIANKPTIQLKYYTKGSRELASHQIEFD